MPTKRKRKTTKLRNVRLTKTLKILTITLIIAPPKNKKKKKTLAVHISHLYNKFVRACITLH